MKKIAVVVILFAVAVTDTFAQTMLNVRNYSNLFISGTSGNIAGKYTKAANEEDIVRISNLNGNEIIDTPLEILLLSGCAGVVDVRPVEATQMLGTPKQADLKFGSWVFQEIQILRFLGNTASVGRHEAELKIITDRGNVTRAEVEAYFMKGISDTVDTYFNATYSGFNPAMVYAGLKAEGRGDALALIKETIINFYTDPTRDNYARLTKIHATYWVNGRLLDSRSFGFAAGEAFYRTLDALSPMFAEHLSKDVSENYLALSRYPSDPRFDIFSYRTPAQR